MFSRHILRAARPAGANFARVLNFKGVMATAPYRALATQRITIEEAKKMAKNYDEMPNDILLSMAIMGDQEAREERLIREVMSVDNVSW
jgi:hypothetical protein